VTTSRDTLPEIRRYYRNIVDEALTRAHELGQKVVVFESDGSKTIPKEYGVD